MSICMKSIEIKTKERHDFSDLISGLVSLGYERVISPNSFGQFSVQGGNLSVFPVNSIEPVGIELFGLEVETIFVYDQNRPEKRRKLNSIEILPNMIILAGGAKLMPGDYLVHEDHGVGIFRTAGIKKFGRESKQYVFIEYLNNNFLYLPYGQVEKLSPYIGIGKHKPKLSRLGSTVWQKTYRKTYENVLRLARELLNLYALRTVAKREPWRIDPKWNEAIIGTFPYRDTPDQAKAVADVFSDLEGDNPMDRLISGDVGFGKTEVAIRAAAQAIANGYQVAVLVPTTVLVEQHFVTFCQRFKNLPVKIERLSRFVETGQSKQIIGETKQGKVDILIGTHRLLGSDLDFKRLGLLIIDEEQKFGVKQKEKLKNLKSSANVLCLSATPIPRTLFMALSGIRDVSTIVSPPAGRKEIETKVGAYDEKVVRATIERELEHGGQVYYLHNEVSTIGGTRNKIAKMFPRASVDVAHGQLDEGALALRMRQFTEGKIDILVCSTIIENGLDLANVNTLVVEGADKFGLSQLYQIRGRIGRSKQQAHALFTYGKRKITDNAFKRLKALSENTELGAGFNIAFSDLEIRGGGNILGREQHGNMEAVGLVLYSKLLKEAVGRLQTR